jgi:RHS repeat-associated protein
MNTTIQVRSFDYQPFGEALGAEQERIGYSENEKDGENSYFAMGARQYDARIGRFLSIDPLFEKFTKQSPYNYAFNSPMGYSDPSGFTPEN